MFMGNSVEWVNWHIIDEHWFYLDLEQTQEVNMDEVIYGDMKVYVHTTLINPIDVTIVVTGDLNLEISTIQMYGDNLFNNKVFLICSEYFGMYYELSQVYLDPELTQIMYIGYYPIVEEITVYMSVRQLTQISLDIIFPELDDYTLAVEGHDELIYEDSLIAYNMLNNKGIDMQYYNVEFYSDEDFTSLVDREFYSSATVYGKLVVVDPITLTLKFANPLVPDYTFDYYSGGTYSVSEIARAYANQYYPNFIIYHTNIYFDSEMTSIYESDLTLFASEDDLYDGIILYCFQPYYIPEGFTITINYVDTGESYTMIPKYSETLVNDINYAGYQDLINPNVILGFELYADEAMTIPIPIGSSILTDQTVYVHFLFSECAEVTYVLSGDITGTYITYQDKYNSLQTYGLIRELVDEPSLIDYELYLDPEMTIPYLGSTELSSEMTLYMAVDLKTEVTVTVIFPELYDYNRIITRGGIVEVSDYNFDDDFSQIFYIDLNYYDVELYAEPEFINKLGYEFTSNTTVYGKVVETTPATITIHFQDNILPDLVYEYYHGFDDIRDIITDYVVQEIGNAVGAYLYKDIYLTDALYYGESLEDGTDLYCHVQYQVVEPYEITYYFVETGEIVTVAYTHYNTFLNEVNIDI